MVKLTFYGGVNEIGGNKVLLEDGDTRLFFDFGTSFAKRWLLDLLELGLLPPLQGLYREDLTCGADLWRRFQPIASLAEVDGVLLSHAHLDHSGYISFLRPEIPIYATAMTSFVAKAIQDSGKGDFEKEVCYAIPKEEREGVFQSADWKREAAQQRGFRVLDPETLTSDALAFWHLLPPFPCRPLDLRRRCLCCGNKLRMGGLHRRPAAPWKAGVSHQAVQRAGGSTGAHCAYLRRD